MHAGSRSERRYVGQYLPARRSHQRAHDYKAAAVIAQRVADLVTRTGQPHIYTPLTASSRAGYWPPSPVIEGDNDNHRWQMLTPKKSAACSVFPDGSATDTYTDKLAEDGAYARRCGDLTNAVRAVGKPSSAVRVNGGGDESPLSGLTVFAWVCVAADDYSFRTRGAVDDLLYYQIGGGEAVMPPPCAAAPRRLA